MNDQKILIRDAIMLMCADLKTAGIDSPVLDAQLLLCSVLNTTRTALIASGDESLSQRDFKLFQSLIERRKTGECTAYITGKKEFWGLDFLVNPSVLVPRPDTETLVEAALNKLEDRINIGLVRQPGWLSNKSCSFSAYNLQNCCFNNSIRVLDLCTGSGAVAISLKHEMPKIEIWAADVSASALETAGINASRLLPTSSIIHFHEGDLFAALPTPNLKFALIVSNPPYIPAGKIKTLPAEVKKEPRIAIDGGKSGLEIIERIINEAPNFLEQNGMLLLEADPEQMEKTTNLLEIKGFSGLQLYKDLSNQARVISGKYKK